MTLNLTDAEVRALYYSLDQPHLIRHGAHKAALKRAAKKLEDETFTRRREAIFKAGQVAARQGKVPIRAVFDGCELGSMESMTFFEGVRSVEAGVT